VFSAKAREVLANPALDQIVITDSASPQPINKMTILDIAPLFAKAITCIHSGGSIVALLQH
jgi:ribose-phosphate pyrophosphokinase